MELIMKPNIWIFDAHQDIAIAGLFTNRNDFFVKSRLDDGRSIIGIQTANQSDYPRLLDGNVGALFGSSCAFSFENGELRQSKNHYKDTVKQIMYYHELKRRSQDKIFFIRTQKDFSKIEKEKLGFLLHVEGTDMLLDKPELLKELFALGIRSVSLTWNFDNKLAGGSLSNGFLSKKGKDLIKNAEKLGVLVDLAHLNMDSTYQALACITKPCIISHTNCKALYDHPRNVDDTIMQKVSRNGGVVCISGVASFISDTSSFDAFGRHVLHALSICGEDHVAFGSDFSVMTKKQLTPLFSESSDFPHIVSYLQKKGLSSKTIEKITHGNIVRVLQATLPSGERKQT